MKKIKNIAFITPDYPPNTRGGCAISSSLLVRHLRKLGYQVDVYCFNTRREVIKTNNGNNFYFKGIPKVPFLNNFVALFHLKSKLSGYNIVHVYNMGLIPAAAILKKSKYKLVATINNPKGAVTSTYIGKIPLVNRISNFLSTNFIKLYRSRVDVYFALTKALKKLYIENSYNSLNIVVIPNMYDPIFLKPTGYPKKTANRINLLYSGQLGDNKGILDLIEAFDEITKKYHNVNLKILGKGKYKKIITERLRKYHLESRITFAYRPYPEVRYEYFSSDILIHPAKWFEPFSRVWLEAMCANLLIVSTKNPSALEILRENVIFYNTGNKKELINSIEKAIAMIKKNNVNYSILEQYSPREVVSKIIKFYEEV